MAKSKKPAKLSDFKDKKRYKYIGDKSWITPCGVLKRGYNFTHTGKEWKSIFIYDFSENTTPPFNKLFKEVYVKKK